MNLSPKPASAVTCLEIAWENHAPELRSWLRQRLKQAQDVDDLMQDLFMKALRQGSKFCDVQNTRAWFFEVARNALADRLKLGREMVELPENTPATLSEEATVDKLTACLPRVLSELKVSDRQAIERCDLGGMSQADYAREGARTESPRESRLQHPRQRLRERMAVACQVTLDPTGHVEDFVPRPPLDQQDAR